MKLIIKINNYNMPRGIAKNPKEKSRKLSKAGTGRKHSEETKEKLRQISLGNKYCLGKKHSKETKKKMSETHKKNGSGKWMKGRKLPEKTKKKISIANTGRKYTDETKKKMSEASLGKKKSKEAVAKMIKALTGKPNPKNAGSNSNFWKGGVTEKNKLARSSCKYRDWRKSVFERDDYTCQSCGQYGLVLHPHHKKSFADFKELRYKVDNGITLCRDCHKKTDSYGKHGKIINNIKL